MKKYLLSGAFVLAAFSFATAQTGTEYQEDALYVRFRQTAAPKISANSQILPISRVEALEKRQAAYGLHREMASMRTLGNPILERTFQLRMDSTRKIEQLLEELRNEKGIELVERIPIYYLQGAAVPQQEPSAETETPDPFYTKNDPTSTSSWHLNMINAEDAWAIQTGSDKIKVAVVDNAVWGNHPDLQILPENQYNVVSQNLGNSAPPSSVRQDAECVNANNCPSLNWSHGTHCAGAVGAIRNNGIGIASIGSGVTLMGVSCPGTDASGLAVSNTFQGVAWAASHGAKVISLSWGNTAVSETDRAIIQSCIDSNIIVVAAAGNEGLKDSPLYPAYLPGVISVASVDNNRQISSFSNNGEWVCIASPGGKIIQGDRETQGCIFSTTYCTSQRYRLGAISFANGEYYDGMFGTSMATPIVSGLCGLILSADSTVDPYLMREILVSSAQPIAETAGKNIAPNSGIIDAAAALRSLPRIRIPRVRNLTAERNGLDMVLRWEKPQTDNEIQTYQVFLNNVLLGEVSGEELSFSHKLNKVASLNHYGVRALYANKDTSMRAALDVNVPDLYTIETVVEPAGCGTVTGAGVYPAGTIRLTAQAADGCKFSRWMEENDVLGRTAELDYTVEFNAQIRAIFTGTPTGNSVFESDIPVNVYPNPTSGKFVIETEGNDNLIEIFSIDGVRVSRHEHIGESLEIGLHESGTYVIKVSSRNGSTVRKLVVR
ncbi:MAG: S8 family serine peptidase [Bacteroides sp.]|nr:S8 family serine peptidase [Bacteroides sp.]MCM1086403.1 S8 family serine peptidase [Bacteroides sp.]